MTKLRADLSIISDWIRPNSRVLDLGCGRGALLSHLKERHNITGYGLEIEVDKIADGIRAGVNVLHRDLDTGKLDFASNSFDFVIMAQTLQAIKQPDVLIDEMARIGKSGIITFPNFGYWENRLRLFFKGRMPLSNLLPYEWYNSPNIHLCTLRDFEKLCHEKHITITQRTVVDLSHQTRLLTKWFPNWFGQIALYQFTKA
ncbi:MAG: methionine biosynthesis protein MetW [Methylococcales bacterium]|jgi:methionine biosynthesis protein MetW|nr:methionine biosynthesis protein MetW [Methylococcales bacterium]MBT7444590.1 methionine biosynthesis protein MetW [Methylococcales bacterium]